MKEEGLFGVSVRLARRICAQAEPRQILAPIVVRELAAGKGFLFSDYGDVVVRGFEDSARLYEVSARSHESGANDRSSRLVLRTMNWLCAR